MTKVNPDRDTYPSYELEEWDPTPEQGAQESEALAEFDGVGEEIERAEARQAAGLAPDSGRSIPQPPPGRSVLRIRHVTQKNGYFCGPASGTMILRHMKAGRSKVAGGKINQRNLGNRRHMRTAVKQVTSFSSGRWAKGMNLWLSGKRANGNPRKIRFRQVWKPSVKRFENAMVSNNFRKRRDFGVGAVEGKYRSSPHYNNHPYFGEYIGHWLVGRGWARNRRKAGFVDPVAGRWPNVSKRFAYKTGPFVKRFIHRYGNGIAG